MSGKIKITKYPAAYAFGYEPQLKKMHIEGLEEQRPMGVSPFETPKNWSWGWQDWAVKDEVQD